MGEGEKTKKIMAAIMLLLVLTGTTIIGVNVVVRGAGSSVTGLGSSSGSWTMFRHDLIHSGYSTSIAPSRNCTKWIYATNDPVLSSPAVANGTVFVGSSDDNVYAFNERVGTVIWNYTTGGIVTSSPAVADGRVFFGSYDKKVYALNETTGTLLWSYLTGAPVGSSPTVSGGKVFIGSSDGKVYALDEVAGTLTWSHLTGGSISSSPAVSAGTVFVGSEDAVVYALSAATGALIWNYTTGGSVTSSPSVAGGRVFIGSSDKKVYALNATNGLLAWTYLTGSTIGSSPAVADGRVFVGSYDQKVYALNQTTGVRLWSFTTRSYVFSSPAVANGMVFVGSEDYMVYALDEITGNLVWTYLTGAPILSSPSVSEGMVFVGSSDYKVYAFGIHDIGILNVTPSKTTAIVGDTVTVNVLVKNEGNFTEVFSVATYYNTTLIANQTVALADGSSTTVPFLWKTSNVALGTYTIRARASVVPGETHTADNSYTDGTVKIINYPKATFTFSPTIPLANQTVTFNATASTPDSGTIVAYGWNFGDGSLGAGEVVTHAYARPGNYTVILTVTDSEGLTNQATANVKVIWYPTAKFSYSPIVLVTTEPVTFDASASTPNSGTIVQYSWNFGDNTTATGKILTHTYSSVGTFIVVLNVTNSEGLSSITQNSVTTYARPVPYVYYYPSYPSPGELVTFSASYSSDLNGTIVKYTWNFSDGTPLLSGKIVTHYFPAHAVYTVQLTVTNNYNLNKTISFRIGAGYLVGDADYRGKIDMIDIGLVAGAFGAKLGDPRYSSACDINNDGKIDMIDVGFVASEFGKRGP